MPAAARRCFVATHAGKAAVQVGKVHVRNRHGRAEELPRGKSHQRRGKEANAGAVGRLVVGATAVHLLPGPGAREDGRRGGRTHVQQRARVHAEAVGGQHRLEVVQVGVDGVQVVIELVPARKKEERG